MSAKSSSSSEPEIVPVRRWWRRSPAPLALALVASLAVHVGWVLWMPSAPPAAGSPPLAAIELSIVEPATVAAAVEPVAPAPGATSRPVEPRRAGRPTKAAGRPVPPTPKLGPDAMARSESPQEASAPQPAEDWGPATPAPPSVPDPTAGQGAAPGSASAAALSLSLSPRAAAASVFTYPAGERSSPPFPPEAAAPAAPVCLPRTAASPGSCELDDRGSHATARLQRSLEDSARAVPHLAAREPPRLRRQGDGSYRYDGHVFAARVGLDGHVDFQDRPLVQPRLSPLGVGATFDLTDAVEHGVLGKERYSAEKSWFLKETAELRAELAESARAAERRAARRALERELERILADAALAAPQKRARVFALWQDCGDDQEARETQLLVEAFVRARMTRGAELGFSEDELRRMNASRAGMRPFAPYREPAAGAPG